ncbi:MAG: hypothetical protein JXC36_05835 [Candidatus Atribacteria bacterium]|nr:hypothetical protein [Candidatus Atribacteria bacterium]
MDKHSLYLEAGGGPIFSASINFENYIAKSVSGKLHWFGRIGLGGAAVLMGDEGFGGFGAITMLTGNGNRHFEMNGGAFFGIGSYSKDLFVLPILDIGYRYQKPEGKFIFKAKIGTIGIGVGLGYAF